MKSFLLIGLGRFGKHVAHKLSELDHSVLAVDIDEARVNDILPIVSNAQIGDATNEEFLRSLGVGNFDACIVAIGDDFQSSLEATAMLKDLGAKKVISRAATDVHEKFLRRNGADEVVYPEKQLAGWTAISCTADNIMDYIEIDTDHSVLEVDLPDGWEGKTVAEVDVRKRFGFNILAIRRGGKLNMSITPDLMFERGDVLLILGKFDKLQKMFRI